MYSYEIIKNSSASENSLVYQNDEGNPYTEDSVVLEGDRNTTSTQVHNQVEGGQGTFTSFSQVGLRERRGGNSETRGTISPDNNSIGWLGMTSFRQEEQGDQAKSRENLKAAQAFKAVLTETYGKDIARFAYPTSLGNNDAFRVTDIRAAFTKIEEVSTQRESFLSSIPELQKQIIENSDPLFIAGLVSNLLSIIPLRRDLGPSTEAIHKAIQENIRHEIEKAILSLKEKDPQVNLPEKEALQLKVLPELLNEFSHYLRVYKDHFPLSRSRFHNLTFVGSGITGLFLAGPINSLWKAFVRKTILKEPDLCLSLEEGAHPCTPTEQLYRDFLVLKRATIIPFIPNWALAFALSGIAFTPISYYGALTRAKNYDRFNELKKSLQEHFLEAILSTAQNPTTEEDKAYLLSVIETIKRYRVEPPQLSYQFKAPQTNTGKSINDPPSYLESTTILTNLAYFGRYRPKVLDLVHHDCLKASSMRLRDADSLLVATARGRVPSWLLFPSAKEANDKFPAVIKAMLVNNLNKFGDLSQFREEDIVPFAKLYASLSIVNVLSLFKRDFSRQMESFHQFAMASLSLLVFCRPMLLYLAAHASSDTFTREKAGVWNMYFYQGMIGIAGFLLMDHFYSRTSLEYNNRLFSEDNILAKKHQLQEEARNYFAALFQEHMQDKDPLKNEAIKKVLKIVQQEKLKNFNITNQR